MGCEGAGERRHQASSPPAQSAGDGFPPSRAECHLGPTESRERGGLSGSGFVPPDSSEEPSDSLPCRCAASGSSKDRAAGRRGGKRRLGLRCQNTILHLLPGP